MTNQTKPSSDPKLNLFNQGGTGQQLKNKPARGRLSGAWEDVAALQDYSIPFTRRVLRRLILTISTRHPDAAEALERRLRDDWQLTDDAAAAGIEAACRIAAAGHRLFNDSGKIKLKHYKQIRKAITSSLYRGAGRRGRERVLPPAANWEQMMRGQSPLRPDKAAFVFDDAARTKLAAARTARAAVREHWQRSTLRGEQRRAAALRSDLVSLRHALVLALDPARAGGHGKDSPGTTRVQLHRLKQRAGLK